MVVGSSTRAICTRLTWMFFLICEVSWKQLNFISCHTRYSANTTERIKERCLANCIFSALYSLLMEGKTKYVLRQDAASNLIMYFIEIQAITLDWTVSSLIWRSNVLTSRWHINDAIVKSPRFSVTSIIGGNYSHPVGSHHLQAEHGVSSQSNWDGITACPFRAFYQSHFHIVPLSVILHPFRFLRFSSGQWQCSIIGGC